MTLSRKDGAWAVVLFGAALAGHVALVVRLAAGRYYDFYNLAFDFDPIVTLNLLTTWQPSGAAFAIKHPLMVLLRPAGHLVMAAGAGPHLAAGLVMAVVGAGTVVVVFLFLRSAAIGRAEAGALASLYAVSGTALLTSIITETYGFAAFLLALTWLLAQRGQAGGRLWPARCVVAAAVAGVTVTNAIQPAIAEVMVAWRRRGPAVLPLVRFGVVSGLLFGGAVVAVWHAELWVAAHDPVQAVKAVWYLQTKGPTTGVLEVVRTFAGFSFVSPAYTVVPLGDGTRMVDFREWRFAGAGHLVAWAWLAFLVAGGVAGVLHRGYRPLALAMGAALLCNVVLHLDFQFRFSLYLYAAHTHLLVFALAAGGAPWVAGRRRLRAAYVGGVLLLAAAIASVNVPVAIDFTQRFDVLDLSLP